MITSSYIDQEILKRNRGIYFRRGKWVYHIFFLLFFIVASSIKLGGPHLSQWHLSQVLLLPLLVLPFLAFFYIYCLYLIPYCFKRNEYKKFWIILLSLLAIFPLIDFSFMDLFSSYFPKLKEQFTEPNHWFILGKNYFNFVTSFIGFSAMLYFMELLESINIEIETDDHQKEMIATELHSIKTQMNPEFMIRSLDGIIQLSDNLDEKASDSVIDFSDVLRYRLYRSKERWVPLQEELVQLQNIFRLHNAIPRQEESCVLDIEGDPKHAFAVPLSLINIVEPLLTTFKEQIDWSLLYYMLIEEKEIQVVIELDTNRDLDISSQTEKIHKNLELLLYTGLNFTVDKVLNTYSLRTCIPIFRKSIAL